MKTELKIANWHDNPLIVFHSNKKCILSIFRTKYTFGSFVENGPSFKFKYDEDPNFVIYIK